MLIRLLRKRNSDQHIYISDVRGILASTDVNLSVKAAKLVGEIPDADIFSMHELEYMIGYVNQDNEMLIDLATRDFNTALEFINNELNMQFWARLVKKLKR